MSSCKFVEGDETTSGYEMYVQERDKMKDFPLLSKLKCEIGYFFYR